jgi:hypothetical protein
LYEGFIAIKIIVYLVDIQYKKALLKEIYFLNTSVFLQKKGTIMADSSNLRLIIVVGILALFVIITCTLSAATLGTLIKQYNDLKNIINVSTTTTRPPLNSVLAESIRIADVMSHLNELQRFADNSGNTRAIGTGGFNETLNYIYNYLTTNAASLNVFRQLFSVQNFTVRGNPTLTLSVNEVTKQFTYSTDLARSDFTYVNYSASIDLKSLYYVVVPNSGCNESDWLNVIGRAALVIAGGSCTYAEKGVLANKYNASALLFYNNGLTTTNLAPSIIRLRQANKLPALFLSYSTGQQLINAANTTNGNASIFLQIELESYPPFNVDNICADTKDGDISETIVVGSHSDGVPAGPGINDNGLYKFFQFVFNRKL